MNNSEAIQAYKQYYKTVFAGLDITKIHDCSMGSGGLTFPLCELGYIEIDSENILVCGINPKRMIRFDNPVLSPITPEQEDRILGLVNDVITKVDAVVVADYSKGSITPRVITEVSRIANAAGRICIGDSRYLVNCFQNYTVITPNDQEAIAAVRHIDPGEVTESDISDNEQLENTGATLLRNLCLESLVITRGKNGMSVFTGDEIRDLPVTAKDVFDPTGAGDTASAAIALSLSSGADVFQAAEIANHASGIVIGKHGTATVDRDELIGSILSN